MSLCPTERSSRRDAELSSRLGISCLLCHLHRISQNPLGQSIQLRRIPDEVRPILQVSIDVVVPNQGDVEHRSPHLLQLQKGFRIISLGTDDIDGRARLRTNKMPIRQAVLQLFWVFGKHPSI